MSVRLDMRNKSQEVCCWPGDAWRAGRKSKFENRYDMKREDKGGAKDGCAVRRREVCTGPCVYVAMKPGKALDAVTV